MTKASRQGKCILIITYVFPPSAWVGTHRTLKYCKYLGDHGWTPIVVTARTSGVTFTDETLLKQVPSQVVVHRTFDLDPAKWEARLAEWQIKRRASRSNDSSAAAAPSAAGLSPKPGLWAKAKSVIKALLTDSPDSHVFWVPFVLVRGIRVLLTKRVDIIYCTSPPHSSHLAAALLAKLFRLPLVLDFRDPWYVRGSIRTPSAKVNWLFAFETWMKRMVVRSAARVICVSRGEREEMVQEFPELAPERFTFITNGYDPSDLVSENQVPCDDGRLTLIHSGTIYPSIAGEFFEALSSLVADTPDIADRIRVRLVGEVAYDYRATVEHLQATGVVKAYGLLPHARTLAMMQQSDVLVILMGGTKYMPSHIPAKVFEYLWAERPILAIAREGELTEIIRQSGVGIVVAPDRVGDIVTALRGLVLSHGVERRTCTPNREYVQSFERAALTRRLAEILGEVAP